MKPLLLCVCLLSSSAFAGQYYVCTDAAGKKLFSQSPCAKGSSAEVKTYENHLATTPDDESDVSHSPASTSKKLATESDSYRAIRDGNRRNEITRDIKKTEQKISELERRRDLELALLRRQKSYANNNLAGATYQQSISTEMQTVTDRYASLINNHRDDISRMRTELATLSQ